jgi:putative aminopeptidase FrvX
MMMSIVRCLLIAGSIVFAFAAVAEPRSESPSQLLQELVNAPGPPGFEEPVRAIMFRELKASSDVIRYDGLGSLIAQQGNAGPRIMLDAHMDEVGGMVRRVTPTGYLSMQMLGAWLDQALPDQRWLIMGSKGPIEAVTDIRDIHAMPADERNKPIARDAIFLDVGAKDARGVAALGIEPGDAIVPLSPFAALSDGRYVGKAWDDRIGCAVLIEAMHRLKTMTHHNQLFSAATVQEEVGARGARTAAAAIQPDIGIAIEAGVVGDAPGLNAEETQVKLGKGPAVFLYDSVEIPNLKLVALVDATAKAKAIPIQHDLVQNYGDDSAAIQSTGSGVPTINLVVPVRSTHAHNGIVDETDFEHTVDLVVALISSLDAKTVAGLRDFGPGQ